MARPAYRNRNLQNGVTMARERIDDWMQMAKNLARAERELQIEHWVYITFEYREDDRSRVVLHKIDIGFSSIVRSNSSVVCSSLL